MSTLALVTAGGLVTSNDAALSVPDWPLSWGRLIPPLEGGIRFEFAHRALAAVVTVLVAALAVRLRRKLAWWALAAIFAQALLGGAVVKLVDPKVLAIAHASLAQVVFGLTVAVAAEQWGYRWGGLQPVPALAVAAIFLQTILGAAVRHQAMGIVPHLVGAGLATGFVMWATLAMIIEHLEDGHYPPPAIILLVLTGVQLLLGVVAYGLRATPELNTPQPMPSVIAITVAHVAMGALVFGGAIVLMYSGSTREEG